LKGIFALLPEGFSFLFLDEKKRNKEKSSQNNHFPPQALHTPGILAGLRSFATQVEELARNDPSGFSISPSRNNLNINPI